MDSSSRSRGRPSPSGCALGDFGLILPLVPDLATGGRLNDPGPPDDLLALSEDVSLGGIVGARLGAHRLLPLHLRRVLAVLLVFVAIKTFASWLRTL